MASGIKDENLFLQQANLRVHSSLRAERLLQRLLAFAATQGYPLGQITLGFYDSRLAALRIVVEADVDEGRRVDRLTPLSGAARASLVALVPDGPTGRLRGPVHDELERATGHRTGLGLSLLLRVGSRPAVLSLFGAKPLSAAQAALLERLERPLGLSLTHALAHQALLEQRDRLLDDNRFLDRELARLHGDVLIGADHGLRAVMARVHELSDVDDPVWLQGEPGSGRGVVARVLHDLSARRRAPLVRLSCVGSMKALERELLGDPGRPGRIARADGSTLFLDGAQRLDAKLQQRLVRLVLHGKVDLPGGVVPTDVDVRLVLSTTGPGGLQPELARCLAQTIVVPPLRERPEDIPALVRHVLDQRGAPDRLPDPAALQQLAARSWPGNVAQLRQSIEQALLQPAHAPPLPDGDAELGESPARSLDQVVAAHIRAVLDQCRGRVNGPGGAAEQLGIHPNTLRHRMRKLGISFGRKTR